jgi:aerobic carbon-monoxide dehydrogenase medium subunit
MKPAPVEYIAPTTVESAINVLATYEEPKILAGGQSLVPMLNFRLANPEVLVDITRIPRMAKVDVRDGGTAIGGGVRQAHILADLGLRARCPLLAKGLALIGHPQIRSRGTVVGSLLHHDPAAELPAVAVALGARIVLENTSGARTVEAEDFFLSHYVTAADVDDLAVEAWFPDAPDGSGAGFAELTRRHGDFALVGAAAQVTLVADTITDARISLSAVGSHPIRCRAAEGELIGTQPTNVVLELASAAAAAAPGISCADDLHATSAYRRDMIPVVVRRALDQALHQARSNSAETEGRFQ